MEQTKFERAKQIEKEIGAILSFVGKAKDENDIKERRLYVEVRNGSSSVLSEYYAPESLKDFVSEQLEACMLTIVSKAEKEIRKLEKEFGSL